MNFTAQIIGLIASIILIIGIQYKKKRNLLIFTALGDMLFVINFVLLGAYTGALICLLTSSESLTINILETKHRKQPKILLPIFLLLSLLGGMFTYENIFSIIPIVCSIFYAITILSKKMKNIRRVYASLYILWVIYDIIVGAYTAVISDIFIAISTFISIIRYDLVKQCKKKTEN